MDRLSQELLRIFQEFGFIAHEEVRDDVTEIFENFGNAVSFLGSLRTSLKFLKELGSNATSQMPKRFEKLKNSEHYSMRFRGTHNIRVLYSYSERQELILLAFHERTGKKASEYESFFSKADRRYLELSKDK